MGGHRLQLVMLLGLAITVLPVSTPADGLDDRLQERRDLGREAVDRRARDLETQTRDNRRAVQQRLERRDDEARRRHQAVQEDAARPWQRHP